jgi:hypothetical protein
MNNLHGDEGSGRITFYTFHPLCLKSFTSDGRMAETSLPSDLHSMPAVMMALPL